MGHPRHLTSTVTVESIGEVDVSTIDLSLHGVRFLTGCETCLFWGRGEYKLADAKAAAQAHYDAAQVDV